MDRGDGDGDAKGEAKRRAAGPLRALSVVLIAASPFVLYMAVTRLSVAQAALVVAGFIAARTVPALLLTATRAQLFAAAKLPLIAIAFALVGALSNDARLLLLLPSATQLGFALVFASSLRAGRLPLAEQFARMQRPELAPAEVRYCRTVTWVWTIFLSASAAVGLGLAWAASLELWAAFTGVGAYVLIGALFGVEYTIRRIRFPQPEGSAVDRAIARLFSRSAER